MLSSLAAGFAEVFLPVFYVSTVIAYAQDFFREDTFARRWKSVLLTITVLLHFAYIGSHAAENGRCMVTTPFEVMSLIAFTLTALYAVVEYRTKISGTGMFFIGLAAIFELISAVMVTIPSPPRGNPVLANPGLGLHVTSAVLGFGGFAISAVYASLYLMMYRDLKKGIFGSFFRHLPSLEAMERMCMTSAVVGFIFMTIAMGIGVFWLPRVFVHFSYWDPKLIATTMSWLLYVAVLVARYLFHLDGKSAVTLALLGFILALLSMTVVNAFFSGFHSFF